MSNMEFTNAKDFSILHLRSNQKRTCHMTTKTLLMTLGLLVLAVPDCISFTPKLAATFSSPIALNGGRKSSQGSIFSPKKISLMGKQTQMTKLHLQPELDIIQSSPTLLSQVIDSYTTSPYAFMLPVATLVATSCQLAGIGGAALFSPIFLLIFPVFGLELSSPAQAVASALLTEVFGFASGLLGYSRRGLVDWQIASKFMVFSIPSALLGALAAGTLSEDVFLLRALYASLMIGLAAFLTISPRPEAIEELSEENCAVPGEDSEFRTLTAADGTEYTYFVKPLSFSNTDAVDEQDTENDDDKNDAKSIGVTLAGSTLTGLLGVGVGEVILPQLIRGRCMPLPVAAGTSVAVVVTTALTAAVVQFLSLALSLTTTSDMGAGEGSMDLSSAFLSVIPWNLVEFTIPGVLIGGQLAPFLASRGAFSDEQIETFAATLFGVVGIAFAIKAILG